MRMRLRLTLLIGLISVALAVAGIQVQSAAPEPRIQVMTEALSLAETRADFDLMQKALEEAHTGLYRYSTKAEMDRVFAAQRAKLSGPATRAKFAAIVVETLSQIRCGHTGLTPDNETQNVLANTRMFPLRIMVEGKRLVVLFNNTPDDQIIRPGMEVLEINGRKAGDILDRILPAMSADGDIETGKRARLQRSFGQNYWLFIEQATDFTVSARDAAGKTVTAKLVGVTEADRAKIQNPLNAHLQANIAKLEGPRENVWMRFLKEPDIALIRIRGFGGKEYPQWIEDTFRTLREKGFKTLVIDLRGNGGGADMYGAMLVSYLTDKPFRYFDHINVKTINPSFKEFSNWPPDREAKLREGMTAVPTGGYLVTAKGHPGVAEQPPGRYREGVCVDRRWDFLDGGGFLRRDPSPEASHLYRRRNRRRLLREQLRR